MKTNAIDFLSILRKKIFISVRAKQEERAFVN